MRTDGRESDNVEDRRDEGPVGGGLGGGGLPLGRVGIGTVVVALVASYFLGVDPRIVLGVLGGMETSAPTARAPSSGPAPRPTDARGHFVSVVLADTEDTWTALFRERGRTYVPPKLVLYTRSYPTACGTGRSAAGPFYCPEDRKVYLDTSFFDLLQQRFHAPGDFAQAYVIAHEVGHHVQNLLGVMAQTAQLRQRMSERQYNAVSVRVELQADCFAGIWGYHAQRSRQIVESGDLEEALRAASAIGDDTLQKQTQGQVVPESFTHGTSEQRVRWFRRGFESGRLEDCNTFDARSL
ncbi:MAG TPA: neutral zinc metallopeptidase [Burkholderiaceae bacterium]|nr:neutral zinc metallopeptidase [Burkholderiaceae bacterium]